MIVSLIVGRARNGVIGRDGDLPWRLPADLAQFKRRTMGHHLVMGRRTFESLPGILPGRPHLVLSRDPSYAHEGIRVFATLEDALAAAEAAGDDETFVIGGGAVYREALPRASRVYLTRVHADVEGDVTFDDLDPLYITEPLVGSTPLVHPETGEDTYDWTHANGLVLSPDGGSILVSFRHQDWMVSIDRETGAMQWRLGVNGDIALQDGTWFHHQHSPEWQPDGSLMLYDNGVGPSGPQVSRVVRYTLDLDALEATQVFEDDDQAFSSFLAGDADLLPRSGNILTTDSAILTVDGVLARIRELDPNASPMAVWQLSFEPGYFVYRTTANDRLVGEAL